MTGRYPDGSAVQVRYPLAAGQDGQAWPWLPGRVLEQCGPDEWQVRVEAREVVTLEDGSQPPRGTPDEDLWFPVCFRDATELRPRLVSAFRCPCCGDDMFGTPPLCGDCRMAGCEQGTDASGELDWWDCRRETGEQE